MREEEREKLTLVVMAAGMGSRFGGLKQLEPVGPGGEFILEYSAYDAWCHGFEKIIFIVKEETLELFHDAIGKRLSSRLEVSYCVQRREDLPLEKISESLLKERNKPWGTAHAVYAARNQIDGPFMVINADDFYGGETFQTMAEMLRKLRPGQGAAVAFSLEKTMSLHGGVSRGICAINGAGRLENIQEHTDIRYEKGKIYSRESGKESIPDNTLISMNVWGFHGSILEHVEAELKGFLRHLTEPMNEEFQLPTMVNELIEGNKLEVLMGHSHEQWYGITYRMDKDRVVEGIQSKIRSGEYPVRLWEE